MKYIRTLLPILFILFALSASIAYAQDKTVVVERRDADMTLHADGTVDVIETWVVNFQGGPFHFAFRSIPLNRVSSIEYQGVSENGQAYQETYGEAPNTYALGWDNSERKITWYFSPTTNATRTFELRYTLRDALRIYDDGDQFWWKFIENGRGYPIQSAHVTVHLPSEFSTSQLAATTYLDVNENSSGAKIIDGSSVGFNGGPFANGTEWEVRVGFPHGVIAQSKQAWQATDDAIVAEEERVAQLQQRFNFYSTLATLLILVGGALGILLLWFVVGRDSPVALPAEFLNAPPDMPAGSGKILTPALAGTLIDEEANVRDVLATLIDWAQRGIITIRATTQKAKSADPNLDYTFTRKENAPPLEHAYERELMQRLFKGEMTRGMLSIRASFTDSLDDMFKDLYDELTNDGYFAARPDRVRGEYRRLAWLLLVLICPAAFLFQVLAQQLISDNAFFSLPALAPWLALSAVLLALMFLSRFLPRKSRAGSEATARWNAFRRYLEHIEKYTNVASAQDQFEKYLPYAVAFGIDKTWVEKFAAVDTPAPKWYTAPSSSVHTISSRPSVERPISSSSVSTSGGSTSTTASHGTISAPSLNSAASGAFQSLNNVSSSFFSMLNATATSFVSSNPSSSPSSGSFRSGGSSSSWHSSSSSFSSSSHSSFSSGGGGGGGGHSGFG